MQPYSIRITHLTLTIRYRQYKKPQLKVQLLEILRKLKVPLWSTAPISPEDVDIRKVSGALTNAVFFVSLPSIPTAKTLLLRVYGSSSGNLISRPRELHILHVLSSKYKIGPRVYGTFDNGRIEEFFDSVTLTSSDIRDPQVSRWIAARMAELHCVDIEAVGGSADPQGYDSLANVSSWLAPAEEVLALPGISNATRQELNIKRFKEEWAKFSSWVVTRSRTFGTRRVFAHNDAQYGNLLRLKDGTQGGIEEHRQVRSVYTFLALALTFLRVSSLSRSSSSISNTPAPTLPPLILQTISLNGAQTTMAQHRSCSRRHDTLLGKSARISTSLTSVILMSWQTTLTWMTRH